MAFKKGDPKPPGSGIKKGQQMRRTVLRIEDYLLDKKIHPMERILALLPSLDPADQVKTWLQIIKYIEPELKPIEALLNITPSEVQLTVEAASTEDLLALEAEQSNETSSQTRALEEG